MRSRIPHELSDRGGFALITVLWVLAAAATVASVVALDSRAATEGSRNRIQAERAAWAAFGCAEVVRRSIDALFSEAKSEVERRAIWLELSRRLELRRNGPASGCVVVLEAVGARADVRAVDARTMRLLLRHAGAPDAPQPLVDAYLDWIDTDDHSLSRGGERSGYEAERRIPPRNGPIQDARELALIHGFESAYVRLLPFLSSHVAPIALNAASRPVLLTVPGLNEEIVGRLLQRRRIGAFLEDERELLDGVTDQSAQALLERYTDLVAVTSLDPLGWSLLVTANTGSPSVTSALEVILVRGSDRVAVQERRVW